MVKLLIKVNICYVLVNGILTPFCLFCPAQRSLYLLQQCHPLRLVIPAAAGDAVQVDETQQRTEDSRIQLP